MNSFRDLRGDGSTSAIQTSNERSQENVRNREEVNFSGMRSDADPADTEASFSKSPLGLGTERVIALENHCDICRDLIFVSCTYESVF